ncbi:MAG: IS630 transposase-related protein [Synergistes jonesii]|uniref:IS630 transposase-related protein n=1 Tax=Synergistes jonesii TaxID=2754 RepID=UPI002A749BC8|nr:IS630 transposase-related protein [Synergistes jonesii]MDY2983709.1 IS630 transposase-related protein [Synergistes jonesii]
MTVYSKDLRERAIKYILDGHSYRETSKVFNVGTYALCRWKKMLDEQGDLQDKPRRKYFRKIDPKKLEDFLRERPNAYLREAAEIFGCSKAAVSKALKRMNYTKKKRA